MTTFKRILCNVNVLAGEHPALRQALTLAARDQAKITIVDVLPDVPPSARRFVTDQIEQELVDHRWELLRRLAAKQPDTAETLVLRGKPSMSLVREVIRGGYDLLVRGHGQAGTDAGPYGPTDMQLLRKCPCPVWLVGPVAQPPRKILAAIDASCNDPGEADLNRSIVDLALSVQAPDGPPVTVLYAWSAFGYDLLQPRMSKEEFQAFVDAARDTAAHDAERFVSELGERRHRVTTAVLEGEPHDVLPAFAREHGVDLVVMGSVGRAGLAGFIMGNTAERIITQLRGSLVAIKPAGFVSPVTVDESS